MQKILSPVPVIGILRDIPPGEEKNCIQTVLKCGLKAIEVTMNTPHAANILRKLKEAASGSGILIGAGTVRTLLDFEEAQNAGAAFMVSPGTIPEVIQKGVEKGIPMIPGALTPTEIQTAFDLGAAYVKVFPVKSLGGTEYIKDLRGPFRDIKLLACGGVQKENARAYLEAGADLLALGGSIFNAEQMKAGRWDLIEEKLKAFINAL